MEEAPSGGGRRRGAQASHSSRQRSALSPRQRGEPRPYDFRRQNTLSRDHVRTLQIVQETFARGFTTVLGSQLRSVSQVTVRVIEQQTYDEYIRWQPNPNLLTLLSLEPLSGAAILQIPVDIAFCVIEMLMGGPGDGEQPERPLSDLELILMRQIIEGVLPELRTAFDPVVGTTPRIVSQESNPQYAQIAAPTDMVIVVAFDVKVDAVEGTATLCIPFSSLQPHLEALSASSLYGALNSANRAETMARLAARVEDVPVEVAARLRSVEMTAGDIVALRVGDVVPLGHPVDEAMTLTVDDVPTHLVHLGRRTRRLAVLVDRVATPADLRPASRWRAPASSDDAPGGVA